MLTVLQNRINRKPVLMKNMVDGGNEKSVTLDLCAEKLILHCG